MSWLQVFAEFVLPIAATLLLAVLVPVAHKLGALLAGKATVETQIRIEQMMEQLVIQGIHYAEEQARNALRAGGDRVGGAQKLELALRYVSERLKEADIVGIAANRLRDLIESKLHYERPELESLDSEQSTSAPAEPEPTVPATPAVQ
jgi:hypothetical protein